MAEQITNVAWQDAGDDILNVTGHRGVQQARVGTEDDGVSPIYEDRPVVIEARGWVSAMTNHFDPDAIGTDGHRKPNTTPREMTDAERHAYAVSLLEAQNR